MTARNLATCVLKDVDSEVTAEQKVNVIVENDNLALVIHPEGYGTFDGDYAPILLEQCKGTLRLLVWGDVNNQEPTHIIDLTDAQNSQRQSEG